MTFTSAALAIDGALTPASLQRLGMRAAVKQSGIINPGDLKVSQLSGGAGNGVQIAPGGAVIENRYVSNSGQAYVIENVAADIVDGSDYGWPATNPGIARSHLVCVSIGDPQYSFAGAAPWFTALTAPADDTAALTYQYVRPMIIANVPAGTKRVEDLVAPPTFPCYAIARLDLASNWTTIADAAIIDLRSVVNARTAMEQWNVAVAADDLLSSTVDLQYEVWPDNSVKDIYIPPWATKVYVNAYIQSFFKGASILNDSRMRVSIFDGVTRKVAGTTTTFYSVAAGANTRHTVHMGAPMSIPSADRGAIRQFCTEAALVDHTAMNNNLKTDIGTSVSITLRFTEEAV